MHCGNTAWPLGISVQPAAVVGLTGQTQALFSRLGQFPFAQQLTFTFARKLKFSPFSRAHILSIFQAPRLLNGCFRETLTFFSASFQKLNTSLF